MGHKNADFIRDLYAAFDKADLETIQNAMAEDSVLHVAGRSSIAGDYKGRDEVLGYLGELVSRSEGSFKVAVHDILGNDNHVVVLSEVTAQAGGKKLDTKGVEVFHVKGGKVTEAWFTGMDNYATDEFFS